MKKAFVSWSGGKDSMLALHYVLEGGWYEVPFLFAMIDKDTQSVPIHQVHKRFITRQGLSLGIHTRKLYYKYPIDNQLYERLVTSEYKLMKIRGIDTCVFGDIHLDDVREFKEHICHKAGIRAVFPLWGRKSADLVAEFIDLGYKAQICSIQHEKIDSTSVGKELTKDWFNALHPSVDRAGENGEYHTFVWDGPLFKYPVEKPFDDVKVN